MADLTIERVPREELAGWSRAVHTTFLDPEPVERPELIEWRDLHWDTGWSWGVRSRGRWVATLRTFSVPFSVPGPNGGTVDVTADGVTAVTVAATHRRRGLLRAMISESLQDAYERGEPVSILIAAEWPIYGRYGYWPASQWAKYTIATRAAGATLLRRPTEGQVYEVERADMQRIAPDLFERIRTQRPANLQRDQTDWDRIYRPELRHKQESDPIYIVHEDAAGAVDGYLSWRATDDFDLSHGGKVSVGQVLGTSASALAGLWDYLLNMDVVDELTVYNGPVDDPIRLLLADGRVMRAEVSDAVWLRLLDVPKAMSARRYAASGRLAFELLDDDTGGYAAGCYVLDADADGAQCVRTSTVTPQLRMSQRALAGVYLGDFSLRLQQQAGLVDELEPGAIARADAMLHTGLLPWPITPF